MCHLSMTFEVRIKLNWSRNNSFIIHILGADRAHKMVRTYNLNNKL